EQPETGAHHQRYRHRTADRRPVVALTLEQPEAEREESGGDQKHAYWIQSLVAIRAKVGDEESQAGHRDEPDREVEFEDPAPAPVDQDPSAQDRCADRGQRVQATKRAKGGAPAVFWKEAGDEG